MISLQSVQGYVTALRLSGTDSDRWKHWNTNSNRWKQYAKGKRSAASEKRLTSYTVVSCLGVQYVSEPFRSTTSELSARYSCKVGSSD